MQQQTATAIGVTVPHATVAVRVNVQAHQPALAAANQCKGVSDLTGALANRLDLGTAQLNAAFERLVDKVLVMRRAILGNELRSRLLGIAGLLDAVGSLVGFVHDDPALAVAQGQLHPSRPDAPGCRP